MLRFALLLFAVVFLLRIFYSGFVWADEGLWFTAARELLRGRVLYTEIWFDKPPAVAWVYAALFAVAGPSLLAVRLFTMVYAAAVALLLWHLGRRLWGEDEGRLAALLYAIYNATYIHSQVQPMAVDHLMLAPYLYAGFFFIRGRPLPAGLLAAVAFSINPKAAALLPFFIAAWFRFPGVRAKMPPRGWAVLAAAFLGASLPWAIYLLAGDKWHYYVRDFWRWGFRYVSVYSPGEALVTGVKKTLNYAGFHFPLFLGLALLGGYSRGAAGDREREASHLLWLWLFFSFLGVAAGGRFFPRYFYQVLPLLCLLAARGYQAARRSAAARFRRVWLVLFWAGVAFAVVRFHARAAVRAYELATGRQTAYMAAWRDPAMDRGSRLMASKVSGALFVWGYRPEIYFYCGCTPASSFLSSQPLTGVPADIQLSESRSVAPDWAAENRRRLLRELEQAMPAYIVDGLGLYNPALAMEAFPELRAFLDQHYRRAEEAGNGIIYARATGL